jgi:two-component system, OmpR family, phosphate regulon sensor histidine kinase PhoR
VKTSTLRTVVVLAVLSILGITITQVYWVRKAFDLKQADFDRQVNTALLSVAQQFFSIHGSPPPANNPVVQLSTNYYAVMLNSDINANVLEFLLRTEFEKRSIKADFEYGIYDCSQECIVYGRSVTAGLAMPGPDLSNLPKLKNSSYYFGVRFPGREAQIINQMGIWTFSSVVLLVVLIFFAYALFVIFKQKKLSEIQKDFINNMTHEFKTPLSTIALSAEVLRQQVGQPTSERTLNYTSIIEQETQRMRQHLERMLQIARLDRTDLQLKKEPVDVHALIEETLSTMHPAIHEKKAVVTLELNSDPSLIMADRHHLLNVFFNLVDNALKYSDGIPEITIRSNVFDKALAIEVNDKGIGIATEHQKLVFQKFYRVPTGNVHNVKGFGLGLSYVQQVIRAHGGRLSVKSEKGNGSTFFITLPFKA